MAFYPGRIATGSGIISTTWKIVILVLAVVAAFPGQAAAQGGGGMIAYQRCAYNDWVGEFCYVGLVAADGSGSTFIGDGILPALSPDGSKIAFVGFSQPGLFVLNLADGSFANVRNYGEWPAWSPDGTQLAFSDGELYVMRADGSNVVQLTNNVGFGGQPAWSPDGRTIAFECVVESGNVDICAIDSDGTGFRRLTFDPAADSEPAFSPDGFSIVFNTRYGIAVMNSNGTGVSPVGVGGFHPVWSPDGTRIAFAAYVSQGEDGGACQASHSCDYTNSILVMNRDGTGQRVLTYGDNPSWALSVRPFAQFESRGCNGLNCTFDGSASWDGMNPITTYTWDFGDGISGSGTTVTHAYAASGTYIVKLTVTDTAGISDTQSQSLAVVNNVWPTARFTFGCIGWRCTLDGSGASDPDGFIANYVWYWGDGDVSSGMSAAIVTHTYRTAGPFTVTLVAIDNGGATGTQRQVVNLPANAPPVASFTATCTALACTFDGSGSLDADGMITSYAWSFGDTTTGSGVTASHTYQAGGTYTVGLIVADNIGATGFKSSVIAVNAPPVASFTATCTALACTFDGSGSSDADGMITSYAWSFGDTTTGSGVTASHTYTVAGYYAVSLTVSDNAGAAGVRAGSVTVSQPTMHIGDLDGTRTNQQNTWTALVTITVHNSTHGPIANAMVSGSWSIGGTASCTTGSSGQCLVSKSGIPKNTKSVIFTIIDVTNSLSVYRSLDNHDPDGDSNGITVTVSSP